MSQMKRPQGSLLRTTYHPWDHPDEALLWGPVLLTRDENLGLIVRAEPHHVTPASQPLMICSEDGKQVPTFRRWYATTELPLSPDAAWAKDNPKRYRNVVSGFIPPTIFRGREESPRSLAALRGTAHRTIPEAVFLRWSPREEGAFEHEVQALLQAVGHEAGAVLSLAAATHLAALRDALVVQLTRCGERLFGLGDYGPHRVFYGRIDDWNTPLTRLREALAACLVLTEDAGASEKQMRDLTFWALDRVDPPARTDKALVHADYLADPNPETAEAARIKTAETVEYLTGLGVPLSLAKSTVFSILVFERLREEILIPARKLWLRWQVAEQLLLHALTGTPVREDLIEPPERPSRGGGRTPRERYEHALDFLDLLDRMNGGRADLENENLKVLSGQKATLIVHLDGAGFKGAAVLKRLENVLEDCGEHVKDLGTGAGDVLCRAMLRHRERIERDAAEALRGLR